MFQDYLKLKADLNNLDVSILDGYKDFMKGTLSKLSAEDYKNWTAKQVYIALGNGLAACADLKIDSTPIEGFDASTYNEILDLDSKGLNACVVLSIGYRSDEDDTQHAVKTRKSLEDLFKRFCSIEIYSQDEWIIVKINIKNKKIIVKNQTLKIE